jgi:hypothetical protein
VAGDERALVVVQGLSGTKHRNAKGAKAPNSQTPDVAAEAATYKDKSCECARFLFRDENPEVDKNNPNKKTRKSRATGLVFVRAQVVLRRV